MQTSVLLAIGAYCLGNAAFIWGDTELWYETVPGVMGTGPLNLHFARDVGLVFLASGGALLWSGWRADRSAAFCGAGWLVCHALYHLWIWAARGLPGDSIALTNLLGIQLPAGLALWAAATLTRAEGPV